jgi:hypothetical protein
MSAYTELVQSEAGLVAYYRFSEPSGTIANDSKGINTGTHVGGALSGQPALVPQAQDFSAFYDGVSDGTTIPSSASLEITGALSLEAWINPQAWPAAYNTILAKYLGGSSQGYDLYSNNDGSIHFFIRGGAANTEIVTLGSLISTNVVAHVVATYKDSTDTAKIYINAISGETSSSVTNALDANASAELVIGARASTGAGNPDGLFFQGWIDELAIYNVELTAGQVLNHYLTGTTAPMEITSTESMGPF